MSCQEDEEWLKDVMEWVNGGKPITVRAQSNPDNTLYARKRGQCGGIEVNLNPNPPAEPNAGGGGISGGIGGGIGGIGGAVGGAVGGASECSPCSKGIFDCIKKSPCKKIFTYCASSPCKLSSCITSCSSCCKSPCCSGPEQNPPPPDPSAQEKQMLLRRMDMIECKLDLLTQKLDDIMN